MCCCLSEEQCQTSYLFLFFFFFSLAPCCAQSKSPLSYEPPSSLLTKASSGTTRTSAGSLVMTSLSSGLLVISRGRFQGTSNSREIRVIVRFPVNVTIPSHALLPHLQQDRGCLHLCYHLRIPHPVAQSPSTCPPRHPHLNVVQPPLLSITQSLALTSVEEDRPDHYSVELVS